MLRDYIDHVYLINLGSRYDRLQHADNECRKIGLPYERVEAVDGKKENIKIKPYPGMDSLYWNQGAAGLVKTTYNIICDAIEKGYERILILEDDVEFANNINQMADENFQYVPSDWHMLQLGSLHCREPEMVSKHIARIKFAYCLHCYIVNRPIFEYYKFQLSKMEKQIDLTTVENIQPLGHCYSFEPNLAYQKASYSNITDRNVNYDYLKKNRKFY